jgi:hypothetical protein
MAVKAGLQKSIIKREDLPPSHEIFLGTGTISIPNPAIPTDTVITITDHRLREGQKVFISTNGLLPIGLSLNTGYFVVNPTVNTFNLCEDFSNPDVLVKTSGTQSGTHTFTRVGFYVRFRLSSVDRKRYSHWSPIYFIEDTYFETQTIRFIDGGYSITREGD